MKLFGTLKLNNEITIFGTEIFGTIFGTDSFQNNLIGSLIGKLFVKGQCPFLCPGGTDSLSLKLRSVKYNLCSIKRNRKKSRSLE